MGELIGQYDWSASPLGPLESWPHSLRTCMSLMLGSRQPVWVGWGTERIMLYNDACLSILGGKHPWALGKPASAVWRDSWQDMGPVLEQVARGEVACVESRRVILQRHGYGQETYHTFSHTPVWGEDGSVAGMYCAGTEDTDRILSERGWGTLTGLAERLLECRTLSAVAETAVQTLSANGHDFPFALFYLRHDRHAVLCAATRTDQPRNNPPGSIDLTGGDKLGELLNAAASGGRMQVLENAGRRLGLLPAGAWETSPERMAVLPLLPTADGQPCAWLLVGMNPYRLLDEKYSGLLTSVADRITRALGVLPFLAGQGPFGAGKRETRHSNAGIDPVRDQDAKAEDAKAAGLEANQPVQGGNRSEESRRQLQRLIMQAPVGMCLFRGGQYVIELVNERQLEIWGKTAEQVVGRPAFEALPEAVGQGIEELFQSVFQTGRAVIANAVPAELVRYGKRELGYYNFTLEAFRDEDNAVTGIVSVSAEVTEQVVYQKKLEESQSVLHQLKAQLDLSISAGRIGIWHWDVTADTLTWSREQHELYGLEPGEFGGRLQDFLALMHPDDLAAVGPKREEQAYNPDRDYTDEFRIIRKDGAVRWIQSRQRKTVDAGGRTVLVTGVNIDITEQKQTEQLLREQQRFTESIIGAAPSVTYIFDLTTGTNAFVSPQIESILGYTPQQVQAMGGDLIPLLLHPADAAAASARFENMLADRTDRVFEVEYRMRHRDGSYVWLADRARVFTRDAAGRPVQILGVTTDLTGRKELEQRMQAQFDELETIYQTAPIGMCLVDRRFRFQRVNSRLAQMNGLPVEAHLGRSIAEVVPDLAAQVEAVFRQVFQTGKAVLNMEVKGRTPAAPGVERIWDESWYPVKDQAGETVAVSVVVEEITTRKKLEEELVLSREKIRSFILQAPVAMALYRGREHRVEIVNQELLRFWGKPPEQVIGKPVFEAMPEASNQGYEQLLAKVYETGEKIVAHEMPITLPVNGNPQTRYVNLVYEPYRETDGRISGIMEVISDVTGQVLTAQRLKESEQRFRGTFENAAVGVAHVGLDGSWLFINSRLARILGYSKEELYGRNFQQLTHPDDLQADLAYVSSLLAGEIPSYSIQKRYLRKDGSAVWTALTVSLLTDEKGQARYFVSIVEDISQRKKAEQALQQSEAQFRQFGDNIQNLAWMADEKGWIYWYNQRWYDYTGTGFEQMQGWGWQSVHHPDHRKRVINFIRQAWKQTDPWELTFPLRGSDGLYRWFLTRAVPIKDGQQRVIRWIGTNTNIDQQVKAQQRLTESELLFRSLAETLPQMVWVSDAEGNNEYLSSRWREYSGVEDVWEAWQYMIHPDDKQAATAAYRTAFAGGRSFSHELRLRNAGGEYRWHSSVAEPVSDATGRIVRWVGALSDIHPQKTLHQQLEQVIFQRTEQLSRSNGELALANEQLVASNLELERFAYVASHDLQEPLRKIITFTRLLETGYQDRLDPKGLGFLERVGSAASRMRNLIGSLLEYSRIGRNAEAFVRTDLNQTLRLVLTDLEMQIAEQGAVIQAGPLPVVWANPDQMGQLLANLISNALKFVPKGKAPLVRLRARQASKSEKVARGLPADRGYVRLKITDNGIGFDPGFAESIFEPFRRLHGQDEYGGSGIGLSICRRIVQHHQGAIHAQSRAGAGAAFIILLPVEHDPAAG